MEERKVEITLDEYTRSIVNEVVTQILEKHANTCPVNKNLERIDKLERYKVFMVGIMVGAGVLGGTIGNLLTAVFSGALGG